MRARSRIRMSFHATDLQAVRTLIFVKCNLPCIVSFLILFLIMITLLNISTMGLLVV